MKYAFLPALALALAGASASAQSAKEVTFSNGDNGGALEVAQSKYGRAQSMSTSIVDLDDDGNAEIAVRFDETCDNGRCDMVVLYFSGSRWQEILDTRSSSLSVGREKQQGVRHIYQDRNAQWSWMNGVYEPRPAEFTEIEEISEASSSLSRAEASDERIQELSQVTRELVDINGDGDAESVVKSKIIPDCTGTNVCPVLVFDKDGNKIADLVSNAARLGIGEGEIYSFGRFGFSSYAFDGQTYSRKDTFMSLAAPGK